MYPAAYLSVLNQYEIIFPAVVVAVGNFLLIYEHIYDNMSIENITIQKDRFVICSIRLNSGDRLIIL